MEIATLQEALRLADLGYPVFPCIPNTKRPITENGFKDATVDTEQIHKWWSATPRANLAICTDGLFVLDIDGKNNPWLGDQDERWNDLAQAPSAETPRGGRHFYFRQPSGKTWRCTQGKLADHVDTRANGGYVVVAPSGTEDGSYRWLQQYELEVAPDQLPEPPQWLIDLLDNLGKKVDPTAVATTSTDDKIPKGRRNAMLASYAGTMRRVGMAQAEIAAALHEVNARRCVPPLPTEEVDRIAASVATYAPDAKAKAEADQARPSSALLVPRSIRELTVAHPHLREPVIHGLLRRGETMNVIAPPKTGKSWLVNDLALAIVSGRTWLEHYAVNPGRVLMLDNELHGETSASRIPRVADARQIEQERYADSLHIINMRGKLHDIYSLQPLIMKLEPSFYQAIILDAFYRFMPEKMDENDNGTMARIYNQLDLYANHLNCCIILIHHTTKGNQAGKLITDVGAGAGSQARATDTHLIMRQHEEDDVYVVDAVVRSWPPTSARCLKWEYPVWMPADELDPTELRGAKGGKKKEDDLPDDNEVDDFVKQYITEKPQPKAMVLMAARKDGLSERRASSLLKTAEGLKKAHRWVYGSRKLIEFATIPKP